MQLTPEESVLLLTCRVYLEDKDDAVLRRLAATSALNWEYVLWRSDTYRTTSLIHYHLGRLGLLQSIPEPIRIYLSNWSALSSARTKALYAQLDRILDAFERGGIEYFLLKGSALSPLLYPDPVIRPMVDLDLMIHPEDIKRARKQMFRLGYAHGVWDPKTNEISRVDYGPTDLSEHHELPAFVKRVYTKSPVPAALVPEPWRRKHLKCFIDDHENVSFATFADLHLNLSIGIDYDDVWRGAHPEAVLGRMANVQSTTGMLWFIAARLYHEAFQFSTLKLLMLGDVHTIVRKRGDEIDWAEVVAMAEKYGMRPPLFYVLSHVQKMSGVDVPQPVIDRLRPDPKGIPQVHDFGDVMPKLLSRFVVHDLALA